MEFRYRWNSGGLFIKEWTAVEESMLWKYLQAAVMVYSAPCALVLPVMLCILAVSGRIAREEEYMRFQEWRNSRTKPNPGTGGTVAW